MRPSRRAFPGVAVLLVVLVVLASAGVTEAQPSLLQELPESDNTVTRIQIHPDGSATWTLEVRTRLDDRSQVETYRSFQDEFQANKSTYLDLYRARISGVVAAARNVTGRDMQATEFEASTRIQELPQRWGIVSFAFRWSNFTTTRGDELVVGDVFQQGFFIGDEDTLEIRAPSDYEVTTVDPSPAIREDGVLTWSGRQYFADNRPQVVFAPVDIPTAPQPEKSDSGMSPVAIGLVLLLSVAVAGGAFYLRHRNSGATESDPGQHPGGRPDAGRGGGENDSQGDGTNDTTADPASKPEIDPIDLLTDEDRVVKILEAHGGRMRQTDIVSETEWSKAKVSRTLSDMEEVGTISKLRIGRQNVIDLVDEE